MTANIRRNRHYGCSCGDDAGREWRLHDARLSHQRILALIDAPHVRMLVDVPNEGFEWVEPQSKGSVLGEAVAATFNPGAITPEQWDEGEWFYMGEEWRSGQDVLLRVLQHGCF